MSPDQRSTKLARAAQVFYHWKLKRSVQLPYLPTEVSLEVTNRCNFKCDFCPQSSPSHFDRVPATQLSPETAAIFLRKLRDGGLKTNILHWTLDGEPFMNKRFADILGVADTYGFRTHHFATNGYFLEPERLRTLPSAPHRYFLTPDFCADETFFEQVRGTKGSWQQVLSNLRQILTAPGLEHFHLKITDISSYQEQDPDLLDRRFSELKALFPASERVTFLRRAFHNATGYVSASRLARKPRQEKYRLCPYPWFSFVVASNGDVVACCRDLEHKTVLGNLLTQEFHDIWNSAAYQRLRRDLIEQKPDKQAACSGCDMPYDPAKGTWRHLARSAVHRMLLLDKQ